MSTLDALILPRARAHPAVAPAIWITAAATAALAAAGVAVTRPEWFRALFALLLVVDLLVLAVRWPRAGALATICVLPFISLLRRLLIPASGWSSYDPLILLGPAVGAFLVAHLLLVQRRRLVDDPLSKLAAAIFLIACIEVLNPTAGGVVMGLTGLLFMAAPLLWFFAGRALADARAAERLVKYVIGAAFAVALYGLVQSQIGLPPWDSAWVQTNGYTALTVGGVTRPFGTFANSSEYGIYLSAGIVFAAALLAHGRGTPLLALPVLLAALFLASSRTAAVLAFIAVIVMLGLRSGRPRTALAISGVALCVAVVAAVSLAPGIQATAAATGNPLIQHQVGGLLNPLDPQQSTLLVHSELVVKGLVQAIHHPLGLGTAATNLASVRLTGGQGQAVYSTEIDLSNAFVGFGLVGGFALLAFVLLALARTVSRYFRERDPVVLAVLGLMIVSLGQWLNGGNYALAPLLWFLVGWVTRGRRPQVAPARAAR